MACRGLFSRRIMYMYTTKHDQKMKNEKIFILFNQNHLFTKLRHGDFAKTICLCPEENCIIQRIRYRFNQGKKRQALFNINYYANKI